MKRGVAVLPLLLAALLFCGSALARVAYVHEATGSVSARSNSQPARPLKVGDLVDQGTTVITGQGASAVIKFEDGQVVALHERSSFTVQQYNYNKQRVAQSSMALRLVEGGMRFVSGVIGSTNPSGVRITTSTATVGIRGTDGTLVIDAITQIVTAAVNAGAVSLSNAQGTTNVNAGNFSSAPPKGAPSGPSPIAQATGAVAATLATLSAKANLPINRPVVVEASARAAAAQAAAAEAAARAAAAPQDATLQAQAQAAAQTAAQSLDAAVAAAVTAYQNAVNAGAIPPAPPAPPPPPPQPQPQGTGLAPATTTTTPTGTTGSGGSGGGGGGAGGGVASPN